MNLDILNIEEIMISVYHYIWEAGLIQLREAGVPTAIEYPKPLHLQKAFRGLGYGPGDFPMSEAVA